MSWVNSMRKKFGLKPLPERDDESIAAGPRSVTDKPSEIEPREDGTAQLLSHLSKSLEEAMHISSDRTLEKQAQMMGLRRQLGEPDAELRRRVLGEFKNPRVASSVQSVRDDVSEALRYALENNPRLDRDTIRAVIERQLENSLPFGAITEPPDIRVEGNELHVELKMRSHAERINYDMRAFMEDGLVFDSLDQAPEPVNTFLEDLKGI